MAECSECGEQSMSFTCRYCGEKFCSSHRLPEKHDCEGLESGKKEEYSTSSDSEDEKGQKWFDDKFKDKKKPEKNQKEFVKPGFFNETKRILKENITLAIIGLTVFSYILQFLVPGYFDTLVLDPALSEMLTHPWTVFSVMLLHSNELHLAANMITFYFFGTAVEKAVGGRELIKLYLISGLVASLGYIGFRNLLNLMYGSAGFDVLGLAVGASGAVVAMVGITAMLYPQAEVLLYFIIPMKIKTAVYLFAGIEGINLLAKTAGITLPVIGMFASSAHLAGLGVGLYYGKKLQGRYARRSSAFNPLGY